MPKWNFINPVTGESVQDNGYSNALNYALKSKPTPSQSGYSVFTGGITESGKAVYGSNHEIGITDTTTHGEEAAIAASLDLYGREDPLRVIAFLTLNPGSIASPCGNCRDSIKEYCSKDLVIVNGAAEGGIATVVPASAYFKDSFSEIIMLSCIEDAVAQALIAESLSYDIYTDPSRLYGAAIATEAGIFRGSMRGDAAYHPVLPISAAISVWRDGSSDPLRLELESIIIASGGHMPLVPYKERQHALEFVQAVQAANNAEHRPLPVYLVSGNECRLTNTDEWLPLPFSPAHLGLADKMASSYRKLK